MTVLNFPASPSNGDTYEENGVIYTWNGSYWSANNATDLSSIYVAIAGDRMTGHLELPGGGGDTAALQKQEIQLLIDESGGGDSGPTDLYWERDAGELSPKVSTDNVVIGDDAITLNADGTSFFNSTTAGVVGRFRNSNSTQPVVSIDQQTAGVNPALWVSDADGDGNFTIGSDGNVRIGDGVGVNGSNANISLNADGSAEFAGSVSIGGTDAAHTIDEYEEGTWTPAYVSGLATGTFKDQGGTYTRIGNLVYLSMTTLFTAGAGTAQLTAPLVIGGLPFTPVAANAGSVSGESNFGGQLPWTPNSVTAGGTQMTVNAASYPTGANMNRLNVCITYQI